MPERAEAGPPEPKRDHPRPHPPVQDTPPHVMQALNDLYEKVGRLEGMVEILSKK